MVNSFKAEKIRILFLPTVTPTSLNYGYFVLSPVSLESRYQDGGPLNSTIDIYDLTETQVPVNSLIFVRFFQWWFQNCFNAIYKRGSLKQRLKDPKTLKQRQFCFFLNIWPILLCILYQHGRPQLLFIPHLELSNHSTILGLKGGLLLICFDTNLKGVKTLSFDCPNKFNSAYCLLQIKDTAISSPLVVTQYFIPRGFQIVHLYLYSDCLLTYSN